MWDTEKSKKLRQERGICFEDIFETLMREEFLDITKNPSKNFPNQQVFIVRTNNYVYYVPFVEDKNNIYLKTIIPSRKAAKKYL